MPVQLYQRSKFVQTASALKSVPSWNFTSSSSVKVYESPSSLCSHDLASRGAGSAVPATVPTIGASGAVAGVLGGYALLFPAARVITLIFIVFFVTLVEIPALVLLGIWFVLQFIPALGEVAVGVGGSSGVAYFAHVGGFLFGLAAIKLFANRYREGRPEYA